jgi:hypothetical protein
MSTSYSLLKAVVSSLYIKKFLEENSSIFKRTLSTSSGSDSAGLANQRAFFLSREVH